MTSAEFTQGLERLGILHQPTLPVLNSIVSFFLNCLKLII